MTYKQARLTRLNEAPTNGGGRYVLYWCQMFRRLSRNHALDYAVAVANELRKPLVVYEGLRLDYPWASRRLHTFVLEGMRENARRARELSLNYWPFVETPGQPARGLVRSLAKDATVVVTDDFPCFIVPGQSAALAARVEVPVFAVDGNGVVPLANLGPSVSAAAHLRPRIHKAFVEAWGHRAEVTPRLGREARTQIDPPFAIWEPPSDVAPFVASLPLDPLPAVVDTPGGETAARQRLSDFLARRLRGYADSRSQPASLEQGFASGLSPYLHFGHLSIEEVVERALDVPGPWTPAELDAKQRGKREGFFCRDANVNAFLDEALTWRDVGFLWHSKRREDTAHLATALPFWALETLKKHATDSREYVYSREEWEAGETHDELWNAAQKELVATGRLHNYLRMLWGKKVLEFSASPEEAYQTLVHLNNKYALDGRNPNSYTGILWTFGLFDRPWPPERKVLGSIRYMSSGNTAKKFKLGPYLDYVKGLPSISSVRAGETASKE